jgi:hypothetical protein
VVEWVQRVHEATAKRQKKTGFNIQTIRFPCGGEVDCDGCEIDAEGEIPWSTKNAGIQQEMFRSKE